MKILVVQDHLRSGGTERQSVLLSREFARAGHEVTLLTFRPGGALASTVAPAVRHLALQRFDSHLDWWAPGLFSAVEKLAPDVILCMGRMANCHAFSLQNLVQDRWPKTAVISTMRTGKPLPWLFRKSLGRVRHVVANSREARDALVQRYRVSPEKVSVIHNALIFPPESAAGCDPAIRAAQGASDRTFVMLCVAMFRPEKNQRELVEIASGLPAGLDWQLWLAGDGAARADCERLAIAKNLGARVKFLGFQRDPSALYRAADVAVHASWSESLSNFLIEAQANGLPGVAYAAQGVAESFVPDETGWVIARDDREAFRATLARLAAETTEIRATRSATARTHARTTFDPARQVTAYLDLFRSLTR